MKQEQVIQSASFQREDKTLLFEGDIDKFSVPDLWKKTLRLKDFEGVEVIDLGKVTGIDSAGTLFIEDLAAKIKEINNIDKEPSEIIKNYSESIGDTLKIFSQASIKEAVVPEKKSFFEKLGDNLIFASGAFGNAMVLAADVFYWAIAGIWKPKGARKGSMIQQSVLIGVEAVPIVALLSFIIGLILALQAAVQLRMVGADIFIADLISVAMLNEMGPMMTAIIVSGRSGSAIASEIATMKVTEELDALKMMAINPIRYVVVPKFYAMTLCMPLLVLISILVGILGGILIAVFYLGLSVSAFYNQMVNALIFKDFVITMIKSTFFAWAIVIIGAFYGFRVEGGAEGVGKATTYSVVTAIFTVIVIDVIFSLLYLP